MPPTRPHNPRGIKHSSLLALSVMGLIGVVLIASEPLLEHAKVSEAVLLWVKGILVPTGQCILSAALIGAAVDRYARTRFVQAVAKESIGYIVGYNLPQSLQAKIQEVVSQRIIRRHLRIRYVLTYTDTEPRQVLMKHYLEWEMANFSNVEQEYQPVFELEETDLPYIIHVACDAPEQYEFFDGSPKHEVVNKIFKLLPRATNIPKLKPHGGPYLFRLAYGMNKPRPIDSSDIFSFWTVTDGLHIEVDAPDDLAITVRPETARRHGDTWILDEAFLVEQHVHILWTPKVS